MAAQIEDNGQGRNKQGKGSKEVVSSLGRHHQAALSPEEHKQKAGKRKKHPTRAVEIPGFRSGPGLGTEQLVGLCVLEDVIQRLRDSAWTQRGAWLLKFVSCL